MFKLWLTEFLLSSQKNITLYNYNVAIMLPKLMLLFLKMGSFVPATEAQVGVVDRLFARIGASDNVAKHMSTFHMEMTETANILTTATPRSFVILDEIGMES